MTRNHSSPRDGDASAGAEAPSRRWTKALTIARTTPQPALFGRDIEDVAALGRCVVAVVFLLVLRFGEKQGAGQLIAATAGYIGLSIIGVACSATLRRTRPALLVLVVDVLYGLVLLLAGGSPVMFVMLYTFAILASAAQLGWRGALITGGVLLAFYAAAVIDEVVSSERVLLRSLYMAAAALLVARAAYDWNLAQTRLYKLARWGSNRFDPSDDAVLAVLRHAAEILEAAALVVIWREAGRAGQTRLTYWRDRDACDREPAQFLETDAPTVVRGKPYVLVDRKRRICLTYDGPHPAEGAVPGSILALPVKGAVVASACFSGRFCEGRLFAAGIAAWRWDQLILAEMVARQVMARLDGRSLREQEARHSADRARARMARDLHDGTLQSLTAARLALQLARSRSPAAAEVLADASAILRDEQQRLRRLIEEQRADDEGGVEPVRRLGAVIRAAAEQWGLEAAVEIANADALLPAPLSRELSFVLVEAVANAAKHGGDKRFRAEIALEGQVLELRLSNPTGPDRSGYAATPRSLSDRVMAIGGTLSVEVDAGGIVFTIHAPVG